MTLEDRLLLIKAGYTKEEIEGMTGDPAPVPSEDPAPEDSAPEQPIQSDPLPQEEERPGSSLYADVMSEIKKLKDAIARQNIQDRVRDLPTSETADDILASILNPKN